MVSAAQDGQSVDAQKRRVREEVKAALRALSTEQMAAESERRAWGWAVRRGPLCTSLWAPGNSAAPTLAHQNLHLPDSMHCR